MATDVTGVTASWEGKSTEGGGTYEAREEHKHVNVHVLMDTALARKDL
jgi:hypothetical protein